MDIRETSNLAAGAIARTYTRQADSVDGAYSRTGAAGGRPRTDRVTLSSTRQEVLKVKDSIRSQPDVRADRIRSLKAAIAGGTYTIDSGALAATLLR